MKDTITADRIKRMLSDPTCDQPAREHLEARLEELEVFDHIHVGHNAPGCLPDNSSAVGCFDHLPNAVDYLVQELNQQMDSWFQMCEEPIPKFERENCAWCAVASDVYGDITKIQEGDASTEEIRLHGVSLMYIPPSGSPQHYWLTPVGGRMDQCELVKEFVEPGEHAFGPKWEGKQR